MHVVTRQTGSSRLLIVLCLSLVLALCGCGTKKMTMPGRAASEQLLISAAADRAIDGSNVFSVRGKKVFFDPSAIDTTDKAYVTAQWRAALARQGALLQAKEKAELAIAPRAGALSIDETIWLFGLPSMTLPIPMAGNIELPELALFKVVTHTAVAKFAALATDLKDGSCVFETGQHFARARERSYWFLLFGAFTFSNAAKNPQKPFQPGS